MGMSLIDDIIENTVIIKSQDGKIEKHYNETEMRKQFAPAKATDVQWNYFKTVAQSQGLDPYDKDIYMTVIDEYEGYGDARKKVGEKVVPLTGYLVYVKRSLMSGKMKSAPQVEVVTPDEKNPDTWYADYSVERTDVDGTFKWRVWMKEVNKKRSLWNIQPKFQLTKTALSQGTRIWFSDVVGGFPYTPEEITQDEYSPEIESTQEEGKVEPSESENKAKDNAKNEVLEKLMVDLTEIKTIAELEKKYKANKAKYESSEMKDSILALFASRKNQLAIEYLSAKTGFSAFQIDEYIGQASDIAELLAEAVRGNVDAITQLKNDIAAYQESQKKAETEVSQEEQELADMEDARASE